MELKDRVGDSSLSGLTGQSREKGLDSPKSSMPSDSFGGSGNDKKIILLPYQKRWLDDKSPFKIWLASRQVGKSFAIAMEAVTEALEGKSNNLILSASERQSREVMEKVYLHLRYLSVRSKKIIEAERETKEEVELPNGSRIISLPANPDTVRGFSGNVFLDEFAFHSDAREIWRAMYPAVTRGYKVRITSTPNGKQNMFYELWNTPPAHPNLNGGSAPNPPEEDNPPSPPFSKGGMGGFGWSRHRTDIHDAVAEGLDVDIDMLRSGINDPEAWAQEFECQFVDEATAFITYEMIAGCEGEGTNLFPSPPAPLPMGEGGRRPGEGDLYLGVDIGRKHDLTVFWLLEKIGEGSDDPVLWTRMVHVMKGEPFRVQKEFLWGMMEGYLCHSGESPNVGADAPIGPHPARSGNGPFKKEGNPPFIKGDGGGLIIRRCCIDSTGIGAQLAEEAAERFGSRVEAVVFTAQVKEDLAFTLRRKFEDGLVRVPADRAVREDIHSVRRFTTASGNARFDAERTGQGHADRFWALALAVHAASAPARVVAYEKVGQRTFTEGAAGHFAGAGCW